MFFIEKGAVCTKWGWFIGDDLFAPHQSITKEQMCVVLYNYAKSQTRVPTTSTTTAQFSDSNRVSTWASTAVNWCYHNGLIVLQTDGTMNPQESATRGEIATMLTGLSLMQARF